MEERYRLRNQRMERESALRRRFGAKAAEEMAAEEAEEDGGGDDENDFVVGDEVSPKP